MTDRQAWTLARMLCGEDVQEEHVNELADPFRALAKDFLSGPLKSRRKDWNRFLNSRDDREEIIRKLAEIDPKGPIPEATEEDDGNAWGPVRLGKMPPADRFPLEILPEAARRLVKESAAAFACPVDYIAVSMLAVAGGTIGRSVALLLKPGYIARASLYVACVGPPSIGKTPAFQLAADGVREIARMLATEHEQSMERWKEESTGEKGSKSKPPKPRRIVVDDITMEAVPMRLADNPRGLIMCRDELSSLLLGMNQYKGGKGNDRPTILKIWSGDAITRDRVLDESGIPLHCSHPCMSIIGGIVPDMLRSLYDGNGSADGFVDRFLFAYPEPIERAGWSDAGVPEESREEWNRLVARLWERPMQSKDGQLVPRVAHFTPEGKAMWKKKYDGHLAEMNALGFPPSLAGPWGKLEQYAGRLALILACLDHASDPTVDPVAVPRVGPELVENAWRLVEYFKSHAKRAHMTIRQGKDIGGTEATRAIVDWVREGNRPSFSERDLTQARRWIEPDDLAQALSYLVDRNVIRHRDDANKPRKKGRPPSPVYDVNPSFLLTQKPQNPQ